MPADSRLNGNVRPGIVPGAVPASGALPALAELTARLVGDRWYNIGYPGAVDFDYPELSGLLTGHLLNNVGDPYSDGSGLNHSKDVERAVVEWFADLFRAPVDDRGGHVVPGGSYGNLYGLWLARERYPDATVFYSAAAHYSVPKMIGILRLPSVRIRADHLGQMDYFDLTDQLRRHRDRGVIVVATAGTTLTEAIDDVGTIRATLDAFALPRAWIHVDAALSGGPLALLPAWLRPGLDFVEGADSITVSGHKFFGAKDPSAVVVARASDIARVGHEVGYTGSRDTTIGGSRSGHAPWILWQSIQRHGIEGHRARAAASRALAADTHGRLQGLGWESFRHEHAFTVVLKTPPEAVTEKWVLASQGGWSHIITMPGIVEEQISEFIEDLAACIGRGGMALVRIPRQRPSSVTVSDEAAPAKEVLA